MVFYNKEFLESLVIQDYLRGKTREQIAKDNNNSTRNVSNITKEWKKKIGNEDAETIRDFVVMIKKSGITIDQSAKGYRIRQLMNKMGIQNYDNDNNKEFINFVKDKYENCKLKGIDPKVVSEWIKDLFCFCTQKNNSSPFSLD